MKEKNQRCPCNDSTRASKLVKSFYAMTISLHGPKGSLDSPGVPACLELSMPDPVSYLCNFGRPCKYTRYEGPHCEAAFYYGSSCICHNEQ